MNTKDEKKLNKKKVEKPEYNLFDDLSFWLTLATTDFSFGISEENENSKNVSEKQKFVRKSISKE